MSHPFTTLPGLLEHVGRTYRNPAAMSYKRDGAWKAISTVEMLEITRDLGMGLLDMGLKPGDRMGIVADSSPFWLLLDLAALGCGAVTVPMFSNIAPENLRYEIEDSGMRFLFVGSEDQYEALRPLSGLVERFIALPKSLESPDCVAWDTLVATGAEKTKSRPNEWDRAAARVKDGDTATLIYTSGSTGIPKGVELTHANLVSQVRATGLRFPLDAEMDRVLSCLPLAHVFERMAAYYYLSTGAGLCFSPEIQKVGEDLREVRPTVITLVPRLLEKMYAKMQAKVEAGTGIRRKLALAAFRRAREKSPGSAPAWKDRVYDRLVYRKLRDALGGRLRLVICGSAPLDPGLNTFLLNAGFPVYEGYGLTEASPVIAVNYPGHRKIGTVGPAFPEVEIRVADDGEILARGPGVMKGYYRKADETAQAVDAQGWLRTGDLGSLDEEGYLRITGRKKELFKTANGKYVAPGPIERILANKLADMAMVIAEGRPFVTALFFPDLENLKDLKDELGCANLDDGAFLRSERARAYLQRALDAANSRLNHWEQVRKFHLAENALSVGAGELTPTLKIRRHVVEEKFRGEIEALYGA